MLTQSELLDQRYLFSRYPVWITAFRDGKWLNSGHDFPGNLPAAITTKFYVAAADCSFGNLKVKVHEQHFTKLSEFKKRFYKFECFLLDFSLCSFTVCTSRLLTELEISS